MPQVARPTTPSFAPCFFFCATNVLKYYNKSSLASCPHIKYRSLLQETTIKVFIQQKLYTRSIIYKTCSVLQVLAVLNRSEIVRNVRNSRSARIIASEWSKLRLLLHHHGCQGYDNDTNTNTAKNIDTSIPSDIGFLSTEGRCSKPIDANETRGLSPANG